jgi:hypothetical protein
MCLAPTLPALIAVMVKSVKLLPYLHKPDFAAIAQFGGTPLLGLWQLFGGLYHPTS